MDGGGRSGRRPDLVPRLRQIAMILVFDLGGPLLAYSLLRSAGMSAVAALVISGVLPALGCLFSLRLRQPLIFRLAVDAGLRRARKEEGRTAGQHQRRRRNLSARPYTLIRCIAP